MILPKNVRFGAVDLNGLWRGKRVRADYGAKVLTEGARMPFTALHVDILGRDIADHPLLFEAGDADGVLRATERGPVPMPWLEDAALIPMTMYHEDGQPFDGDPRHALARVVRSFSGRGLTPICATEMEFYLVDPGTTTPAPHLSGTVPRGGEVLGLQELDAYDAFFSELYDALEAMDVPAQATISEGGLGQFEVNLTHREAMRAADDAVLFKTTVKGMARKHGMAASFMAKPFAEEPGNGMHVHFSVLDAEGRNIFDNGGEEGSEALRHAVQGLLTGMPASTLALAPHVNSFDRFQPNSHAPTALTWAYENRTAAIRIPGGPPAARRVEHRVAGGDVNPYILLTLILGAALEGIEVAKPPPPAISGNAYDAGAQTLPNTRKAAFELFQNDPQVTRLLGEGLHRAMVLCKAQEARVLAPLSPGEVTAITLETV